MIHLSFAGVALPGLRHCEPWALAGRGNPGFTYSATRSEQFKVVRRLDVNE